MDDLIPVVPDPPKKKSYLWLFIPIILFLVLGIVFLWQDNNQLKNQLEQAIASPSLASSLMPNPTVDLKTDWTYISNEFCPIKIPLPPNEVIDQRTWEQVIDNAVFGNLNGKSISMIHRNAEEASGYISGIVTVSCGVNSNQDSLEKINSDHHNFLMSGAEQATAPEGVIELTSNNDVTKWGLPAKEMSFVGGMFDPKQKYYLLVDGAYWYLITSKSDSSLEKINQQTNQIFELLEFK